MKHFYLHSLRGVIVLAGLLFGSAISAQHIEKTTPDVVGLDAHRLKQADACIDKAIREGRTPGAVLAVVRHRKIGYLKAYGRRQTLPSPLPMTENTIFDMASCTKSMATTMAVMQLLEQGKLRLNDPVQLYLPHFQNWKDEQGDSVVIRIVHLLTHTSGLPSYAPVADLQKKGHFPDADRQMNYIETCRRNEKPACDMQYSCLNFITLQHIVEQITGQSLRDYCAEHVFQPLHMRHTDFIPCAPNKQGFWVETDKPCWMKRGEKAENPPLAPTEKQPNGQILCGIVHDPLARVMNGGISGNAGLFSNAEDVAVLCAMLLNGGSWQGRQILSPLTVEKMQQIPAGFEAFGRCLGWDKSSPYASNKGDLLSDAAFGHTGYTGTSIVIDPKNDIAIILLTNAVHPVDKTNVVRLRAEVANAVAGSIIK